MLPGSSFSYSFLILLAAFPAYRRATRWSRWLSALGGHHFTSSAKALGTPSRVGEHVAREPDPDEWCLVEEADEFVEVVDQVDLTNTSSICRSGALSLNRSLISWRGHLRAGRITSIPTTVPARSKSTRVPESKPWVWSTGASAMPKQRASASMSYEICMLTAAPQLEWAMLAE